MHGMLLRDWSRLRNKRNSLRRKFLLWIIAVLHNEDFTHVLSKKHYHQKARIIEY